MSSSNLHNVPQNSTKACACTSACVQTHRLTYTQVISAVLKLPNNPGMAACPYNLKGEADRQTPRAWWLVSIGNMQLRVHWDRLCLKTTENEEEPSILLQLWKTPGQTHAGIQACTLARTCASHIQPACPIILPPKKGASSCHRVFLMSSQGWEILEVIACNMVARNKEENQS